jgi:hypothetical protein
MRTTYFFFAFLVLSITLGFTSCKDDDDSAGIVADYQAGYFQENTCAYADSMSSPNGTSPTSIYFKNETSELLKVYWINFSGGLTIYHELAPGQYAEQGTFLQHPWYITTEDELCVTVLTALRPAVTDTVVFRD